MDRQKYVNNQDYRDGYDEGVEDGRFQIKKQIESASAEIKKILSVFQTERVEKSCENCGHGFDIDYCEIFAEKHEICENYSAWTPKRIKSGHWIMPKQDDGTSDPIEYQVRCSICGFDIDPQTYGMELKQYGGNNYCPNCGAKMEGERND